MLYHVSLCVYVCVCLWSKGWVSVTFTVLTVSWSTGMDLSQHAKTLASGSKFVCKTSASSVMDTDRSLSDRLVRCKCKHLALDFWNTVESLSKHDLDVSTSADQLKFYASETNQSGRNPQPAAEVWFNELEIGREYTCRRQPLVNKEFKVILNTRARSTNICQLFFNCLGHWVAWFLHIVFKAKTEKNDCAVCFYPFTDLTSFVFKIAKLKPLSWSPLDSQGVFCRYSYTTIVVLLNLACLYMM